MYKIAILATGAIAVSGWLRAQQTQSDPSTTSVSSAEAAAPSPAAATSAEANLTRNSPKPRASSGAANYIGMFTDATDLGNSVMYQQSGLMGVNTTTPLDYFHVAFNNGNGAATGYAVQNLNPAGDSGMLFYDQNGALGQFQGFSNSTHEYRINNIAPGGTINFLIGSSSKFLVTNSGIGIGTGTTTLTHLLQVAGSIGAQEVVVTATGADYVFDPGYKLQPSLRRGGAGERHERGRHASEAAQENRRTHAAHDPDRGDEQSPGTGESWAA